MSFSYLPLFTGDYLKDTRKLSTSQHGAYLLALIFCWDSKGPMPLDEDECRGICACRSDSDVQAMHTVLARFFVRMEGGHFNKRMEEEIERAASISSKRSGAAHERWAARAALKAIETHKKADASAMQMHAKTYASGPSPSPSPSLASASASEIPSELALACAPTFSDHPDLHGFEAVNVNGESFDPSSIGACPQGKLLALWGEVLPDRTQYIHSKWTGPHAVNLRARWRDMWEAERWPNSTAGLSYFREVFGYIGRSRLVMGQADPRHPDGKSASKDLVWLVKPANWAKVISGKRNERTP